MGVHKEEDTLDKEIYVPMFGYKDVYDYYDKVSVAEKCHKIEVPVFAVEAADDPICGHQFSPVKKVTNAGSKIMIGVTRRGAHVCHIEGYLLPSDAWYPKPFMEFLNFMESRASAKKKAD